MLAHKPNLRNTISPTLYLFLALAAILVVGAVVLPAFFNASTSSIKPAANTPAQSSFQTYRSSSFGFAISYPAGWQVVDEKDKGVFSATSNLVKPDSQGGTNFSRRKLLEGTAITAAPSFSKIDVISFPLEAEMSVEDFLLAKSNTAPQGEITNIKVAGKDAIRVAVQTGQALPHHSDNQTYTSVFLTHGKTGYIVAGFASADVLEQILTSFQVF